MSEQHPYYCLASPALLNRLFADKLETVRADLIETEGWAWAEARNEAWLNCFELDQANPPEPATPGVMSWIQASGVPQYPQKKPGPPGPGLNLLIRGGSGHFTVALWNAQHLAGVDLVRIAQHRAVGFEDLFVARPIA